MSNGNVVVMNFKVTPRLKAIIESHAKRKKMAVSEYMREAILFDMLISGNIDAFKYVVSGVGEKVSGSMRSMLEKAGHEKIVGQ